MANTVNSIMLVIYGVFGMGLGLLILISGMALGSASSIPSLGDLGLESVALFGLGGLVTVVGALGIVAGVWVWQSNLYGVWLECPLLGIGIAVAFIIIWIGGKNVLTWEVGLTVIGINTIMIALTGWGWDTIKSAEDGGDENLIP